MVKAVKKLESGVNADTVAREYGISRATLYNWKSKYSGMDVSQIKRLKELEERAAREADRKARDLVVAAMQRCAVESAVRAVET